jgi:hypothetical protein
MWLAIWQLSARRTLTWYLPVFLLLVGYTLVMKQPLGVDPPALLFGILLGWVLGFRLFVDPPGVSPFILSRPFSRTRLFFYRWTIGLLLQAFTLAVIFTIIASGLRQAMQVSMFNSHWYPMVRWFELSMLWPVALASLLTYQTTCFVLLRGRLRGNRRISKPKRLGDAAFLAIAALLAALFLFAYVQMRSAGLGTLPSLPPLWQNLLLSYGVLLAVTTTLASLYCSRHFEVDA